MPALRIQMHLRRNPGLLQRNVVSQRIVYVVHVVVLRVTRPTMTVYSPKGKNAGAAVVVFPGGGYQILAIDLEATEVCDWLVPRGITCVLLKYRVTDVGAYPKIGAENGTTAPANA
jgi:acetyl esterase/lipase